MKTGHLVIAYHGCDITTRDDLVRGTLGHLQHSNNKYDWLGPGSYFFEDDYARALMFAQASHDNPKKRYTAKPIATPAVVGAVLQVQHWLDMTIQAGIEEFCLGYSALKKSAEEGSLPKLPGNTAASPEDTDILLRQLDNAIFTFIHQARDERNMQAFQAVRAAFYQGEEIAPASGFRARTHVQIALRDNSCVQGWFLPPGAALLTQEEYADAKEQLEATKSRNEKPRQRAV